MMTLRLLFLAGSVVLVAAIAAEAGPSPAARVADGQPWNATTPEGRQVQLTFFPDGTAQMKVGILRMKMTWTESADGLCLKGGPQGDRCLTLTPRADGFTGDDGSGKPLTLTR